MEYTIKARGALNSWPTAAFNSDNSQQKKSTIKVSKEIPQVLMARLMFFLVTIMTPAMSDSD